MSASDYISLKRMKQIQKIPKAETSSQFRTRELAFNTIRDGCETDEYGELLPHKWYTVRMGDDVLDCSYVIMESSPLPIVQYTPTRSIENYWQRKLHSRKPIICKTVFPNGQTWTPDLTSLSNSDCVDKRTFYYFK